MEDKLDSKLNSDLAVDWLKVLQEKQDKNMNKSTGVKPKFFSGPYAETVFTISDKLNMNREAKYLALELFYRFYMDHISDLFSSVKSTSPSASLAYLKWEAVVDRLKSQLIFRVATCCQLASKYICYSSVLSMRQMKAFLKDLGFNCSSQEFYTSELRVLATVDYRLGFSFLFTYVDCLYSLLRNSCLVLDVNVFDDCLESIVDLVYIHHDEVSKTLIAVLEAKHPSDSSPKLDTNLLTGNHLATAAAILCFVSHICQPALFPKVLDRLVSSSGVTSEDCVRYSMTLFQLFVAE